jgi:putative ABC transport system permease protein
LLGRTFLPEEGQAGRNNVVVLSHGMWQRRFGSDPQIIGQTIHLDTKLTTVIGVLPPNFEFSLPGFFRSAEMWVPAVLSRDNAERNDFYLRVVARLKPGVTVQQAQADMDVIGRRLAQQYPQALAGVGVKLVPLHEQVVGNVRPVLLILLSAVGLVLLIACANVANLQLARASSRQKEMSVRAALGASRGRVVRQLLTESAVLALLGGAVGVAVATWGIGLLMGLAPAGISRGSANSLDPAVLAFSLVISLLTGILFGLAPALQFSSPRLNETLKEGGRASSESAGGGRLRNVLMVSEVALSMVLLIGAGLLVRSFVRLLEVKPGFDTANVLAVPLSLPRYSYPDAAQRAALYKRAIERIGALPGVRAVGAIDDLPLTPDRDSGGFIIEGRAPLAADQLPLAEERSVTPDYFRAMGIPLLGGRTVAESDTSSAPAVLVINQSLARRFFPGQDPVGQRLAFVSAASPPAWITIVGVVGDVRDLGLASQPELEVYQPYQQSTVSYMNLAVRTASAPESLAAVVQSEIHSLDKDLPLFSPRPMEVVLAASIADRRFNLLLLGVFASLGLVLAAVGIYGVISYTVARRIHEIGIRMALGAQASDVFALVVGQGLRLAILGVAVGLMGALALTRVLSRLLFGVTPTDPVTFAGVALLLLFVAALACYIPARRALRVDPVEALRYE